MADIMPQAQAARSLRRLAVLEQDCRRCPLYLPATQVVPGRGSRRARLMLVGEQPGDREDLEGAAFVGPAGRLLAGALEEAGIDPGEVFLTNAVKHFKFEVRGKRRIHKKPRASEIDACNLWLQRELALVKPHMVVAMGATAGRALLGRPVTIGRERGLQLWLPGGSALRLTVHPSYLLRLRERADRERQYRGFVDDLRAAAG